MDKTEMDVIMQERIEKFNNYVMSLDIDKIQIGLFSGKMGICIYFYQQFRLTQNKKYAKFAEKLLYSILKQVHLHDSIDFEDGLAGICYGINYLIEENFVKGNTNLILKELDDRIFRSLNFKYLSNNSNLQIENLKIILGVSLYFSIRLDNYKLEETERYLFKNIIIKAINKIDNANLQDKFNDPCLFSTINYFLPTYLIFLSLIYKKKFYNYKIERIFEELSDKLISTFPLLHSNRLFLSAAINSIENIKAIKGWRNHISLLEEGIDITTVLKNEFRNKNILPNNGITGFYYIIKKWNPIFTIDKNLFCEKIVISDLWNLFISEEKNKNIPIGLVFGFCGVILTYQDLKNKAKL